MRQKEPFGSPASIYRALGDPTRLRILAMLKVREVCVCELAERLPMSQPAVSHHLRTLRENHLVQERRDGRWVYYSLVPVPEGSPAYPAISSLEALEGDRHWLEQGSMGPLCIPFAVDVPAQVKA